MERYTFAWKIREGKKEEFRKVLGSGWQETVAFLNRNLLHNFSLWNCEDLIFGYCESDEKIVLPETELKAWEKLLGKVEDLITWISVPGQNMRLMYHDIGIVRKEKELIRHRMFMTRLKPGCEEEYKKRHDGLIEARGNVPDPGPDSNFTIWSAGGYIFGYDEIDTTMEKEETEEEHANTVAWETRQLEIMDWITNDVDWMTGTWHPASVRLAWHL